MYVIRILAPAHDSSTFWEGRYVKSFDANFTPPEPHPPYPNGSLAWTPNIEEAMTFEAQSDAIKLYNTQSTTIPYRHDGLPNRPMTAYTAMIVNREQEIHRVPQPK